MFTAHEAVARDLLARLLEETERAREVATDMEAFDSLIALRNEMLEALDRSVLALAAAAQQTRGARADTIASRYAGSSSTEVHRLNLTR